MENELLCFVIRRRLPQYFSDFDSDEKRLVCFGENAEDAGFCFTNAIVENGDHRAIFREAITELETEPHQSVDALKSHFGEFFESICADLKTRGLPLEIEQLRFELQSLLDSNNWIDPVRWLSDLLDKAAERRVVKEQTYMERYLSQAEAYIQDQLRNPSLSEKEIAEHVGISASYLSTLFRRHRQITPTKYIRDLRLSKAAELLKSTDLTVLEVCNACGFGSLETFHRVFKAEFAISPGKMRMMNFQGKAESQAERAAAPENQLIPIRI